MPIPDYQTLMLPLLKAAAITDIRVPEVEEKIADDFGLTVEERKTLLPSGRQNVLANRLHWAKFYMVKAGLVTSAKGTRFIATDAGRHLLSTNPTKIDNELLRQYPSFQEFYTSSNSNSDKTAQKNSDEVTSTPALAATTTPEEQIEAAHLAVQSALRAELLQRILQNSPSFFEQVIVELLVAMGYGGSHQNATMQLGKSGDGGVDGVINEDRLGLDRVYVQAKRYKDGTVGRPDVQGFVGSLVGLGATKGVFVTTSSFSSQASEYVKNLSQRVILIDGQRLADLMIEHDVGVRISRAIQFKRIDEDFFSESE
ncbi:MAG: restriction endonuclease [Rhodopseudomonas sp.]|nr:restriction endonuclease [Rhodopseudomonas sp.]